MASKVNDFISLDIPMAVDERGAGGGMSVSTPGVNSSQRLSVQVKGLQCEAYRGVAPVEDGGFIIVKPLGEDGLLCAVIDPSGRGPRALEIGTRLKHTVDDLLCTDFLRYAGLKPAAALDRLDEVLDTTMSELDVPGAMAMMGAIIVNATTGRTYLLCRGVDGIAGVRSSGSPAWAGGGGLPPYGTMPRDILFMRGKPAPKSYILSPGDSFILANPHFSELPSPKDISEKGLLPAMAARVTRGGKLEAGGLTIMIPTPAPQTLALPECMALGNHVLRLAGLAADPNIERGELILESMQASYFEALCHASGLCLPEPKRKEDGRVCYAKSAPLAVKGLLTIAIRKETP